MSEPEAVEHFAQPITPAPAEHPTRASVEKHLGPHEVGLIGELTGLAGKPLVTKHAIPEVRQHPRPRIICGTEGVTVTGGFGKWKNLDRRQRVGITSLEGYDPYTVTVPVIFEGVSGLVSVEPALEKLEWMGGRGLLFGADDREKGTGWFVPGAGETPTVYLLGKLVPPECSNSDIKFVVSGIEYNTAGRELVLPIRRPDGERVRQAVTVTLTQYIPARGAPQSAAERARARSAQTHEYKTWVVKDGVNTFRKIAKHYGAEHISEAAREIAKANPKLGASVDKALKRGTRIKVPVSATWERA